VNTIICGVDVSSQWLDARIGRDGRCERFANDTEGIEALAGFCKAEGVTLVVMEATGGYERKPFAQLSGHGVPAAVVHARAVRDFARGMRLLEKTDRIDAGVIAWYAATKGTAPQPLDSQAQQRLEALVTRLRQLTCCRTTHTNQRRLVTDPTVLETFTQVLAVLAGQIRTLEGEISELIEADPLWQKLDQAFRSMKGVADRTVATLMADLPEIGTLSNKAISKLVGLAPLAQDSGNTTGKRSIRGGRAPVRSILFVVAECVRKYDPDFQDFHQRLSKANKAKKVIRVALAHKLLIRLNAKARDARKEFANAT